MCVVFIFEEGALFCLFIPQKHTKNELLASFYFFFFLFTRVFSAVFCRKKGEKKDMTAFTAFCLGAKRSNCMSCLLCTSSLRNWRPFYYGSFFLCVCVLSFSLFFSPSFL